jgi:hypothetical protein
MRRYCSLPAVRLIDASRFYHPSSMLNSSSLFFSGSIDASKVVSCSVDDDMV